MFTHSSVVHVNEKLRDNLDLLTRHTPEGVVKSATTFNTLIDVAASLRKLLPDISQCIAIRERVEVCYPQLAEFLRFKLKYDPVERFRSDWYRRYCK